jgi:hypothetical protein
MWLGALHAAAWRRPSRIAVSWRIVASSSEALAVSIPRSMRGRPSGANIRAISSRAKPAERPSAITAAERAAAPLLPDLPPRTPGAPGQFAFADPGRVAAILGDSGWADVDVRPLDVACTLPEADLARG